MDGDTVFYNLRYCTDNMEMVQKMIGCQIPLKVSYPSPDRFIVEFPVEYEKKFINSIEQAKKMLKIGDTVGHRRELEGKPNIIDRVVIEGIEITDGGVKTGNFVDEVDWAKVIGCNVIVDFANGCWAYAEEIEQMKSR